MRSPRGLLLVAAAVGLLVAGCGQPADTSPRPESNEGERAWWPDPNDEATADRDIDGNASSEPTPSDIALEPVVTGLDRPTLVTGAPDGSPRLFVVEQRGLVRVVENGTLRDDPYLNLTDRTHADWERGFLGMAFSPTFAQDGRLFVSFTDHDGDSVLQALTLENLDPPSVTNATALLEIDQPDGIHNGGHIAFGPDGYLYYGLGDGGPVGDPDDQGQNASTLLGSLLRLDVSGEQARAPPDNPFVDSEEGHDLVWAYGLRNPWRFSFDRATGDLFIADVGESHYEEVNHQPASSAGGENYGWNRWEGDRGLEGDSREGFSFPALTYAHEEGRCAVTGGYVYRGQAIPALEGSYLYGDFCTGEVWAAQNTSEGWRSRNLATTELSITSFGEDDEGELYVVAREGEIHRIVPG